jgi:hypothetical protein
MRGGRLFWCFDVAGERRTGKGKGEKIPEGKALIIGGRA